MELVLMVIFSGTLLESTQKSQFWVVGRWFQRKGESRSFGAGVVTIFDGFSLELIGSYLLCSLFPQVSSIVSFVLSIVYVSLFFLSMFSSFSLLFFLYFALSTLFVITLSLFLTPSHINLWTFSLYLFSLYCSLSIM